MFWRIVGAVLSLTFFTASFSIWGDPTCRSVTMHGGRFGIAYTCLDSTGGASANGFAWLMFFIGLGLLVFNLWPYIRVWISQAQSQHQDSLANTQGQSVSKSKAEKSVAYQIGSEKQSSKEAMRPANCQTCDKKLNKTSKYCQNCGWQVTESEPFQETKRDKTPRSSGKTEGMTFNSDLAFGVIAIVVVLVIFAYLATRQTSQVSSTPTPTPTYTSETYSSADVLAAAGDEFYYVNDGFAMKWDNSERSCTALIGCAWVQVYSMEECTQLSFSLTYTDDSNNVVGKDFQTGGFGLAAGETGRYELEWLSGADLVQIDDITCMWRN